MRPVVFIDVVRRDNRPIHDDAGNRQHALLAFPASLAKQRARDNVRVGFIVHANLIRYGLEARSGAYVFFDSSDMMAFCMASSFVLVVFTSAFVSSICFSSLIAVSRCVLWVS